MRSFSELAWSRGPYWWSCDRLCGGVGGGGGSSVGLQLCRSLSTEITPLCWAVELAPWRLTMLLWPVVIGWVLSIVAILGNGFVICLIAMCRRLHTVGNCFLVSLAVADLGVGSLHVWVFLATQDGGCHAQPLPCLLYIFVVFSSTLGLSAVAAERWVAIAWPLKYPTWLSKRKVVVLICLAWIIPILIISAPLTWVFATNEVTSDAIFRGFLVFQLFALDLCPSLLLVVVAVNITRTARRQARQIASLFKQVRFNHPQDAPAAQIRPTSRPKEPSSVLAIVVVVVLFALCHLGNVVVLVGALFRYQYPESTFYVGRVLYLANSAFNPVAFSFFKRDIKAEAKRLCHS